MQLLKPWLAGACAVSMLLVTQQLGAQQIQTTTPLIGVGDSFYEYFGVDWGFHLRGRNGYLFFNRGGANSAAPAFGGFDPNSAARFGFGVSGSGGGFRFGLTAAQGSSRTITSSSSTLVVPNGGVGYVGDVTLSPFVTGIVPVVGGAPVAPPMLSSPLAERVERLRLGEVSAPGPSSHETSPPQAASSPMATPSRSSAARGDVSLAEIRRRQAAEQGLADQELARLIESARAAEAAGRFGAARIRYRQAADKANGELRQQLLDKLASLAAK